MTRRKQVLLSWSSGKDSAWSLSALRRDPAIEVVGLLTTLNRAADRVAMHAVRSELLERQAERVGLPLTKLDLPYPCSNADYEAIMGKAMDEARAAGVEAIAFGDLFLADIRAYREEKLAGTGLEPLFPLWGSDTTELAQQMVAGGLRAKLTSIDPKQLDARFAGRDYDADLLAELPEAVDPCGERGEFHSFVYDSPEFSAPIDIELGEIVERDGFVFADVLPKGVTWSAESAKTRTTIE